MLELNVKKLEQVGIVITFLIMVAIQDIMQTLNDKLKNSNTNSRLR